MPPFAIFNACSAPDYLFVSNTLRASFSSFSAFAVCSLARHLFASKKAVFKTHNQAQLRLCFFFVRLWARCSRTFVRSAPCPRLPRLVRLAPRLVNVWQEITTPLRMLAFRDFQRLLCARLSLCFKHAPRLVLAFLGSCRLLFGKSPLWQVTSLQAKKQCSRRTTKARRFAVLFDIKVSIKGAFSGFFSIFGTGYKLLFFGAGEDEYRQRHGKRNEFGCRGCQPKPRHLPQI